MTDGHDPHTKQRMKRAALGGVALVVAIAAALTAWWYRPVGVEPGPAGVGFYVWQQKWTPAVSQAVERASARADALFVLLAVLDKGPKGVATQSFDIDWATLAASGRRTVLVFRVHDVDIAQPATAQEFVFSVATTARKAAAIAREKGVQVSGIQVDYDCATSKLGAYRDVLAAIRHELVVDKLALSITALPAWLRSWTFAGVCRQTDFFVLQIHSLEKPTTVDAPLALYDTRKFASYLRRAAHVGVPFYVALPTYGYAVAYDEKGSFSGISAEWRETPVQPGHQVRHVMADPAELAEVVRMLQTGRPRHCLGMVWFRLPVDTDALNWTWETLETVLDGHVPPASSATASVGT